MLATIFLAVGAFSFLFGDKEIPVRTGIVTKIVFPRIGRPYKGKIMGIGFWFAAATLFWEARRAWL